MHEVTSLTIGDESQRLILNRHRGFEKVLPDSEKWALMSTRKDECWNCDKHIVALYIWTPRVGLFSMIKDEDEINYYREKIKGLNSPPERHSVPHIASGNTGWLYKPMHEVKEFC